MRLHSTSAIPVFAVIVAVLWGCSGNPGGTPTVPVGPAVPGVAGIGQSSSNVIRQPLVTDRIIHNFGLSGDGFEPTADLISLNGALYGTAPGGATGNGIVFKITPPHQYTILHNFSGTPDGAYPTGSLINVNGTFYGTTAEGGAYGYGTIFSITPSGDETVVFSFRGGYDGWDPNNLIDVKGTFYGTTGYGSEANDGVIFSLTKSGQYTVLHYFTGPPDGQSPLGGLINVKGTLFGTTFWGGTGTGSACPLGCGTVYSVTTSGVETVLHSFSGPPDGARPAAKLINVNGTMYGTTTLGGSACCGTVFSVDTSGHESVVHSFNGPPYGNDGESPVAPLLYLNGTLYGTTIYGGTYQCFVHTRVKVPGCGTVFAVTQSGSEKVLYSFRGHDSNHADGALPYAGLISFQGALYGTTEMGGAYKACDGPHSAYWTGCGTVFSITP